MRENDFWEIDKGNQEISSIPDDPGYTFLKWMWFVNSDFFYSAFGNILGGRFGDYLRSDVPDYFEIKSKIPQ